jgi:hypothetical protein
MKFADGDNAGSNGDVYKGEWKDDCRYGKGIMKYAKVDLYDGEWEDGGSNGTGTYKWSNRNKYNGEWKDDEINGTGMYNWAAERITLESLSTAYAVTRL